EETPADGEPASRSIVAGLRSLAGAHATRFFFVRGGEDLARFTSELSRVQAYFTDDVSPQPPPPDSAQARFFDGKLLTPIAFLSEAAAAAKLDVAKGGPYREAQVENLSTGGRRTIPLAPGARLL